MNTTKESSEKAIIAGFQNYHVGSVAVLVVGKLFQK